MGDVATSDDIRADLVKAVEAALAGDWTSAHAIVQRYEGKPLADWLHAVLHKIEGDAGNARYWYARTHVDFERFTDAKAELRAIQNELSRET